MYIFFLMVFSPFIGLMVFTRIFLFSPFMVEGVSMVPTLRDSDIFLLDKFTYRIAEPKRDDIVVFSLDSTPGFFYVKRLVGLPGEHLHLKADGVYLIDDSTQQEHKLPDSFIEPENYRPQKFLSTTNELGEDFVVPQGKYFVLGDNRLHSQDSRYFSDPFIPKDQMVGKFVFGFSLFPAPKLLVSPTAAGKLFSNAKVKVQLANGEWKDFEVEVADTVKAQTAGLMFRQQLAENAGMIFIFDLPSERSFWMKNTLIPLDIIFIDEHFQIVHIEKSATPCKADPCPIYESRGVVKYVLELKGGMSEQLGIQEGAMVEMPKAYHHS